MFVFIPRLESSGVLAAHVSEGILVLAILCNVKSWVSSCLIPTIFILLELRYIVLPTGFISKKVVKHWVFYSGKSKTGIGVDINLSKSIRLYPFFFFPPDLSFVSILLYSRLRVRLLYEINFA